MPKPAVPPEDAIAMEILRQTATRGAGRSICPSEVARALAPAGAEASPWQPLMDPVRRAALRLQRESRIEILRKGKPVPAEAVRGVIRLRVAPEARGDTLPEAHGDTLPEARGNTLPEAHGDATSPEGAP